MERSAIKLRILHEEIFFDNSPSKPLLCGFWRLCLGIARSSTILPSEECTILANRIYLHNNELSCPTRFYIGEGIFCSSPIPDPPKTRHLSPLRGGLLAL